jgi:hypothetical protein
VEEARDDQMRVVLRGDSLTEGASFKDVAPSLGYEKRMLHIVVEGVAFTEVFQSNPRKGAQRPLRATIRTGV